MSATHPRLVRSVPFWLLVVGSLATLGAGVFVLVDKLGGMDARLVDGTATMSDVYVGQVWAVLGAILVGAGLIGLALAATLGALRSFASTPVATEIVDAPAFDESLDEPVVDLDEPAGASFVDGSAADEPVLEASTVETVVEEPVVEPAAEGESPEYPTR